VILPATPDALDHAVALLERGELVAFPTETVYGLGADASNAHAVARIFAAKGRPADHPLIVHLGRAEQLDAWARDIPQAARELAHRFWPGPLTLILPRAAQVCDAVTGGQDSVGLRMPSHPVARALLQRFGGIAAPSANRYGRVSATTAQHVAAEFGDAIPLVLDGGPCDIGIESTIVAFVSGRAVLLRPGGIAPATLAEVLGYAPGAATAEAPRAPGTHASHYAPRTPIRCLAGDGLRDALALPASERRGVLARTVAHPPHFAGVWLQAPLEAEDYARTLYANLRILDESGLALILVEAPPATPSWLAVNDRLGRATHAGAQ
jgi:L-threonylcarbamoyladenylate synthase